FYKLTAEDAKGIAKALQNCPNLQEFKIHLKSGILNVEIIKELVTGLSFCNNISKLYLGFQCSQIGQQRLSNIFDSLINFSKLSSLIIDLG
ncbi:hypothetical protein ABPG74_019796, partial [Tetrahymena malaccensis]